MLICVTALQPQNGPITTFLLVILFHFWISDTYMQISWINTLKTMLYLELKTNSTLYWAESKKTWVGTNRWVFQRMVVVVGFYREEFASGISTVGGIWYCSAQRNWTNNILLIIRVWKKYYLENQINLLVSLSHDTGGGGGQPEVSRMIFF